MKNKKFITLGFASVALAAFFLFSSNLLAQSSVDNAEASRLQSLAKFTKVISIVEQYNVDEITIEDLMDKALDGMLKNLDAHSNYLTQKDYKKLKNINLLLQFAREAVLGKAFPFAIEAYKLALIPKQKTRRKNDIRYDLAKTYYAQAVWLRQQGETDLSQDALRQAELILAEGAAQKNDFRTRQRSLELEGDIYGQFLNDPPKALAFYQQALSSARSNSANDRIRLKAAGIYLRQNKLNKALDQYKLISSRQYGAEALFRSAQISYFQAQFSVALEQLIKLQSKLSVRDTLFNNVLRQRQFIEQFRGDSLRLSRFAAAELLEQQQQFASAAEAFEQLYRNGGELAAEAGLRAAQLFERLNDINKSSAILEQMAKQFPEGQQTDHILFLLAAVKEKQNQPKEALALYMRIITNFPDSFQIDQARENARRLRTLNGDHKQ